MIVGIILDHHSIADPCYEIFDQDIICGQFIITMLQSISNFEWLVASRTRYADQRSVGGSALHSPRIRTKRIAGVNVGSGR